MSISIKNKSASAKICLVAATVALISLIAFIVYGVIYPVYADLGVVIFMVLGVVGYLAYVFCDYAVVDYAPLLSVFCSSFALGLFVINAYPVLGDWYGNFNMYGSQGGIAPVLIIFVITLASVICGIITCFTRKNGEVK